VVTDIASVFRDFMGASDPHISPIDVQQSTGSSIADKMPFSEDGLLA
jgi:hypothetical protein